MIQALCHGDQVVLNVREVQALSKRRHQCFSTLFSERVEGTHDIRLGSHTPVLITPLRETLYHIRLVAHESQKTHDLLTTRPDPAFFSISPPSRFG